MIHTYSQKSELIMKHFLVHIGITTLFLCNCTLLSEAQARPLTALEAELEQKQIIRGKVIDGESNSPISGARITVLQTQGIKPLGAVADKNGNFEIRNVPIGRQSLRITALGYQEQFYSEILVTVGKEVIINVALQEKVVKIQEVEVAFERSREKVNTVNEYALSSSRAFNVEDTKKYAGALGDPSRMAQNFAGVVGANDSRNDIVVRGNSPAGMLWQLEGLNIPNPNHFGSLGSTGGPVSMLNNNTLDKSDFSSGAFVAQYGNATAGVFDLRTRDGNSSKHEFLGQIGFNGVELGAEGPLYGNGSSYVINYRYSTLGLAQKAGISFGTGAAIPYYQDVNFRFNLPISDDSKFIVFGLGGKSDIAFLGNQQDTTKTNLYGSENENTKVNYQSGIAGLSFESNLSKKSFLKLTLGVSGTEENFSGDSIDVITRKEYLRGEAQFQTQKYSFVGQFRHKFDAQNSLSAGITIDRQNFNLANYNFNYTSGQQRRITDVSVNDGATLTQGYVQFKHRFSDYLTGVVGIHAQHYSLGEKSSAIEPRASLMYILSENQTLSLGYGMHSQTQQINDYFLQNADGSLPNEKMGLNRAQHVVLGYDWTFDRDWRLKAEAYYQSLYDIPVSTSKPSFSLINAGNSFAPNTERNLVNQGTGRNYGVELTIERFFRDGFYTLFTTSLFDSKYKGNDGVERNTAFNTNYVINILAGKEWKIGSDVFSFSVKMTSTGGRFLTPLNLEESRRTGDAVYNDSQAYSERQTPYFRIDAKIGYRLEFSSFTMEFSVDFQNLTDNKNVFLTRYNRRTNSITTEYQQGFFPVPTFRITF